MSYIKKKVLMLSGILILIHFSVSAQDPATVKIMPFVKSNEFCNQCHIAEEVSSYKGRTTESCSIYCISCHKDVGAHHKVDVIMTEKIPQDMKFRSNRITCFTCHDLKKRRFDTTAWKSESLFESFFSQKSIYKTYYLTIKNNDGKLCKKCH